MFSSVSQCHMLSWTSRIYHLPATGGSIAHMMSSDMRVSSAQVIRLVQASNLQLTRLNMATLTPCLTGRLGRPLMCS